MKKFKKLVALLLAMMMVFSIAPVAAFAEGYLSFEEGIVSEPTEQKAVEQEIGVIDLVDPDGAETYDADSGSSVLAIVIAGSDFQNPNGNKAGAQTVTNILTQMKNDGHTKADGFLFCGDYDYDTVGSTSSTEAGITALKNAVTGTYSTLANDRMVLVEGNHDAAAANGLATSGAHDAAEYGVFVINEDDYMWNNSSESRIQQTANNLKSYLDAKVTAKYAKPIFVVSHLPLHYSMRTKNDGDGKYANYIFDVLNEAGAASLNIIFLYGHDHSNGWDDYLGGAAVYLAKGDEINIAQGSKTKFNVETLNFTYMNAGFTGYYENHNGADNTLTMTVFEISDDTVTVERYDANGKHNLKSAGVTNNHKNEGGYYDPNTTVYESPQTITLATVTPPATVSDGNVSVTAAGLTGLTAAKKTVTFDTSKYSAYASYDITPVGYTQGNTATVAITLEEADKFDTSREVIVIDETGENAPVRTTISGSKVTFITTHFSTYDIAQEVPAEPAERTYTRVTSTDDLVGGQYLLIYNTDTDKFMLPEVVTKYNSSGSARTGLNVEDTGIAGPDTITGDYSAKEWTFTKDGDGWKIGTASGNITFNSTSNTGITATLTSSGNTFTIGGSADNFEFWSNNNCLNYNSRGLINGHESGAAPFYIYRLTSSGSVDPSGGDWVTISDGQGKTIFRLVNSLTSGKKYLIVNSNQAGSANAVNLNNKDINSASVTIIADSKGNYIEAPAETAQWTYTSAKKFQNVSNTGRYLRGQKDPGDSLKTTKDSDDSQTTWQYDSTNGLRETSKNLYILGDGAKVAGLAKVVPDVPSTSTLANGFISTGKFEGTYGTAEINGTKVRYTPKNMQMNGAEEFAYAAKANLENDQNYYYSTVTVIPATTVYYEDSFVDFYDVGSSAKKTAFTQTTESDAMGEWYVEGDANTTAEQALSKLGDKAIYGYDPAYNNSTMFSMDSAKKVTVNTNGQYAQAKFTFKGTGFDVISLTDYQSGAIYVDVYKGNSTEERVKGFFVNNYYGYKQVDGKWVVDTEANNNALYQIPVMKVSGLDYGTYTVVINVRYYSFQNVQNNGSYSFWLDAIRIYDPAGTTAINNEYLKDGEGYPQYIKLRDRIADNSAEVKTTVFIDGGNVADIATYANYGPNNEVYLANGQAISFKLAGDLNKIASVQIGAKAPNGSANLVVNNGVPKEIATATEMYYGITDYAKGGKVVTITNTGSGILSLTNVKVTFTEVPKDETTFGNMNTTEQAIAVMAVRALFAPPAPTVFEPETLTVSLKNYKDVYVREYIKVTVTTSDDVKYITVGDKKISRYDDERVWGGFRKGFVKTGKRVWSYYVSFDTAGQQVISVVAYDADGLASEAVENTVNVKPRSAWRGKKSEWHI